MLTVIFMLPYIIMDLPMFKITQTDERKGIKDYITVGSV